MTADQRYPGNKGKSSVEGEKPSEQAADDAGAGNCRCKDVSKKTILQMLKLMLSDLAFWKKVR